MRFVGVSKLLVAVYLAVYPVIDIISIKINKQSDVLVSYPKIRQQLLVMYRFDFIY